MSQFLRFLKRIISFTSKQSTRAAQISLPKDYLHFSAGDRVLINGSKLSSPLQSNSKTRIQYGRSSRSITIPHNSILGKPITSFVLPLESGITQRIEYPTLDQYVSLTPRLVTPIYASYAASIVNLLDIHWPQPVAQTTPQVSQERLEILEAGTGHGSLTLHLARTIAAANPSPPAIDLPELLEDDHTQKHGYRPPRSQESALKTWNEWRKSRRAIIHTVEKFASNRIHAEKLIRGFRQSLYWPHIDFYVAEVKDWVEKEMEIRAHENKGSREPFLNCAILDLPGVHQQFPDLQEALRIDAKLLAFTPSITQVGDCVRIIREKNLPLVLDKVVELGEGISTGRKWDVRMVNLRKKDHTRAAVLKSDTEDNENTLTQPEGEEFTTEQEVESQKDDKPVLICRPKVGERTIGGGFVGIWRKISESNL